MAKSIEVKAKTVHEAIAEACEKLGVEQDQVNVEVLSQGGMFGKAKVLVTVKDEYETVSTKEETKTAVTKTAVTKTPVAATEVRQAQTESAKPTSQKKEKTSQSADSQKVANKKSNDTSSQKPAAKPNPASSKFSKTLAFVEKLVELLETGSTVTSELTETSFNINVNGGENVGRLIGKGGAVMSAMQTLVSSVAISNSNGEGTRVFIDIEGYKEKRGDSLKNLAVKKAEYVKKSGRFVKLEPMNARDRAIIHTILGEIEGIKTYSTGKDPFRCLCIAPADK